VLYLFDGEDQFLLILRDGAVRKGICTHPTPQRERQAFKRAAAQPEARAQKEKDFSIFIRRNPLKRVDSEK
jgi:hypothetical protein